MIKILCLGKLKETYLKELISDYLVRINKYHKTEIIELKDENNLEIEKIGPLFENHERFPNRTNTEFVEIIDREHVKMRVWERGSGETLACGTGCCAVCVAGVLNGFTEPRLEVRVLGGALLIEWDREKNLVWMTGPATTVFEGTISI